MAVGVLTAGARTLSPGHPVVDSLCAIVDMGWKPRLTVGQFSYARPFRITPIFPFHASARVPACQRALRVRLVFGRRFSASLVRVLCVIAGGV